MSELSKPGKPVPGGPRRPTSWGGETELQPDHVVSRRDGVPVDSFFRSGVSIVTIESPPLPNARVMGSELKKRLPHFSEGHEVIVARPDGATARWSDCGDTAWEIDPGYQITEADRRSAKAASEKRRSAEKHLAKTGILDISALVQPEDLPPLLRALGATDTGRVLCRLADIVSASLREMAEPATPADTRMLGAIKVNLILNAVAQIPRRERDAGRGDRFAAELVGKRGLPPFRGWPDAMRAVIAQAERTRPGDSG